MKRIFALATMLLMANAGVAQAATAAEDVCSLKITKFPGHVVGAKREEVVVLDGKDEKTQIFLKELWVVNRPLFGQSTHYVGPDSPYDEIVFQCGEEKLDLISWHRVMEKNPKAVALSTGVVALEGKTREEMLANDKKEYLQFRQTFDSIYLEAMFFADKPIPDMPGTYEMKIVFLGDVPGTDHIYVIGQAGFKEVEALKKFVANLPEGSTLKWSPGCMIMEGEKLHGNETAMKDFRELCEKEKIDLQVAPSG